MEPIDLQPKNAYSPIEVKLSGNVSEVSEEQPENALPPIEIKPSGNVNEVKELQLLKADDSISITGVGIDIDFKDVHP